MGENKGKENPAFTDESGNPRPRNTATAAPEIPVDNKVKKEYLKDDAQHQEKDEGLTWASLKDEFRINKALLPVKFATLCFHGGVFAFLPYVTLHMKQMGLTNEEVARIYLILPVSSILGPLIGGIVADKLRAFKAVFLFNTICMALLHTLFVTVPYAPNAPQLSFSCGGGDTQLGWSSASCPLLSNASILEHQHLDLTLKNCRYNCTEFRELRSNFTMCLEGDRGPECFQRDISSELQLAVDTGSLYSTSSQPSINPGESSSFCNELTPRVRNVSFEGKQYEGISCLDQCELLCDVEGGPKFPDFKVQQYSTTFWVYLALRIPAQFFLASAMTMMDALTMAAIANRGGDFGKQRLMSMLSLASMSFVSSAIVHNAPTDNGSPDYAITFYFGDALLVIAVIVTACIRIERPESPSRSVLSDLGQLLRNRDILVFLAVILVLGSNWGFLESFFFVYLSELHAPAYLLGLTLTFGCLVGVPAMFLSNRIINSMGRANVFILSFVAYSVRMFGYSIITNPWMSFPFEALEIITYQLMWVAAVTYFPILAPPTLLATMSGLSGTLHYNVGRGVGAQLGGHLFDSIGSVNTFRVFGIISLISGIIYAIIHYCFLRSKLEEKEAKVKEGLELTTDSKSERALP